MKSYISNAFSMNMISDELDDFDLIVTAVDRSDLTHDYADFVENSSFCISNQATCDLFTVATGIKAVANRADIKLGIGDTILVFQYNGTRLEEGLTKIPEGGKLRMFLVEVSSAG